jgi:hypothetical protein
VKMSVATSAAVRIACGPASLSAASSRAMAWSRVRPGVAEVSKIPAAPG